MFLGYIHSFRALAILFIVSGHSIDFFQWSSTDHGLERILRIVMSNGSVLFVFIAGYLFQHLSGKFQPHKYYQTKLKNVILPYFLVSIPAIIVFVFILPRETMWLGFYENPQWLQVVYFYLTGMHLAPLWFVPMISLFYLIAPILITSDKSKVFYWVLPATIVLSCFVSRGLPLQSFIHFLSVYLLGMFCSHYKTIVNTILKQTKTLMLLACLVFVFILIEFYLFQETMTFVNYLQKISLSLFFLGLFIRLGDKVDSKLVRMIANTSFGVFFIHSYILTAGKLTSQSFTGSKVTGNILLYPVVTISVLLLCVFIIVLIQKLFGNKSRYLVGS